MNENEMAVEEVTGTVEEATNNHDFTKGFIAGAVVTGGLTLVVKYGIKLFKKVSEKIKERKAAEEVEIDN